MRDGTGGQDATERTTWVPGATADQPCQPSTPAAAQSPNLIVEGPARTWVARVGLLAPRKHCQRLPTLLACCASLPSHAHQPVGPAL